MFPGLKISSFSVTEIGGYYYSSLSNKRDHHGTFTSPKVTLITLLLASITHTHRAHKFFKFKDQNNHLNDLLLF